MKSYTLGIDARLYFQTGVGTYLRNFLSLLPSLASGKNRFKVFVLDTDRDAITINDPRFEVIPVDARWHSFAEQTRFYSVLDRHKLDLMHFTYFSYPVLYKRPFVATVHDLTPLLFKTGRASTHNALIYEIKHRIFTKILQSQVINARAIITPTEAVKNQLLAIYKSDISSKIVPIHEGVSQELIKASKDSATNRLLPGVSHDFLLYVGNFYPHKNVERLLMAYSKIPADLKPQLVLAGPDNIFSQKLKKSIEKNGVSGVLFLHDTSQVELVSLYKHARALVNPSLSEGFGLPLVEAAYFHCPVIASRLPVFEEILAGEYVPFDPTDLDDMIEVLQTPQSELKVASLSEDISFKIMTEKTIELYANLI